MSEIKLNALIKPLPVKIGKNDNERGYGRERHKHHACAMYAEPNRQLEWFEIGENEFIVSD